MKRFINQFKNEDGFTLIEMTIVILVIAILLIVLVPNLTNVNENISGTTNKALEQTVEAQIVLYEVNEGMTPSLTDLVGKGYITQEQSEAYTGIPPKGN